MNGERKRALVTGLTGQDGSFLADELLQRDYEVFGLVRRDPEQDLGPAEHLRGSVTLVTGDLLAPETLTAALVDLRPDELYHLAGPSFVPDSWREPRSTLSAIAGSTAALLEAVRTHSPSTRLFVAGSGAMFGDARESPQTEQTACRPGNPYATAKLAAHQLVGQMRAQDGIFACSGILYNHESERRPESFVSRKITRGAAAVKLGLSDRLTLGDVSAIRDWSFAGDIVHGCWLMLQQAEPRDYVLASGIGHTVKDLLRAAFEHVGLNSDEYVRSDSRLVRGPEPTPMIGDPSRAERELGWRATMSFEQLVGRMVDADLRGLAASR